MYINQTTISREIKFTGIGLHSGKNVTVLLRPACANSGIIFLRKDLNYFEIEAKTENVVNTTLSTVLGKNGVEIKTVEHFLSAVYAFGIDNLTIEVDGPEMPIMDGSAAPFVYILKEAGIKKLAQKKKYIKIKKPIEVECENKKVGLYPSKVFKISFFLDYNHPLITNQHLLINLSNQSYVEEISRARTFGFLNEVEFLRKQNLALGGSLENAVVIDGEKILNDDGLRYRDEFVRHKILDALGDISLIGYPLICHYKGIRAGHTLNNRLCKKVLRHEECWEFVEFEEKVTSLEELPFKEPSLVFCSI